MKYSQTYTVPVNDTDVNGILSISAAMRFFQDTAFLAMKEDTPSSEDLRKAGYTFFLTRVALASRAPVYAHDLITVETWAIEAKGFLFQRCFRLLKNDFPVMEASTEWALYGIFDHKVHRAGEIDVRYRTDEPLALPVSLRVRIPSGLSLERRGERTVEYADIDENGHMNNTRYPDILCSYLGCGMLGLRVASMALSYLSEAPLGESITYFSGDENGKHYIRSVRGSDLINAEAEFVLTALE